MIKLPKNKRKFNMTNEEYMSLSKEDKIYLDENLPSNIWEYHSEVYPNCSKPKLPCIINGVIIGE